MIKISTKSVLINFNGYPLIISSLMPDNGLASLAASLIHAGHETRILDYSTTDTVERFFPDLYAKDLQKTVGRVMATITRGDNPNEDDLSELRSLEQRIDQFRREKTIEVAREISDYVSRFKPDLVGFKLWLGEGFEGPIAIAKELRRKHPNLPIFAGGPQVDWFKETIFGVTDVFDALAYGEGEETILFLADYVEGKRRLEEVPNLIFKRNKEIVTTPVKRIEDMDSIPNAIYDEEVYPAMQGDRKIKMFLLDESRGCPYSCNFCIHPIKSGKKWRNRSAKRVVEFIEELGEKYDTTSFRFSGSNTPAQLKMEIAKEILKRGLKVTYTSFAETRTGSIDWNLLRKAGNYAMFFGVESGSQYILDNSINKKANVEQIKDVLKACKEAGIFTVASMIMPSPYETEETKRDSLNLLMDIRPDAVVTSLPGVVPGTKWERNHTKYSIEITNPETFERELMSYKIKFGLPPILWEQVPYRINGKDFRDFARESGEFVTTLEKAGLLTQLTDEQALMAFRIGMTPREFRDKNRTYLAAGNFQGLKEMVKLLNDQMRVG